MVGWTPAKLMSTKTYTALHFHSPSHDSRPDYFRIEAQPSSKCLQFTEVERSWLALADDFRTLDQIRIVTDRRLGDISDPIEFVALGGFFESQLSPFCGLEICWIT
jgi:hypothetical protein